MPFILREEGSTENPPLATVYGFQITAGKVVYYKTEAGITSAIIILGDGEMDGIERLYYSGELIPEFNEFGARNWKFHPGTITTQINPKDVIDISAADTLVLASGHGFVVNDEVALVAGVDPKPTLPETYIYPEDVTQHQKLYVVSVVGDAIKLSKTQGGTPITGWPTTGDENTYLETNLKVYKADAGFFDPIQGKPEFFDGVFFTFSGIAYVEVRLNADQSSMEEEPTAFKIFVRGRKLQNYDDNGLIADENGVAYPDQNNLPAQTKFFSANNALIAADIMINYMAVGHQQQPNPRIDWPSFVKFRDRCDEIITWSSGSTEVLGYPSWDSLVNCANLYAGVVTKNGGAANTWDAGALTEQEFTIDANKCKFQAIYRGGHSGIGITRDTSPTVWSDLLFGFHTGNIAPNDKLYIVEYGSIVNLSNPIDYSYGDRLKVEFNNLKVEYFHNDTLVHTTNSPNYGTGNPLVGACVFYSSNASFGEIKLYPMADVPRPVNRFDAHVVFPSEINSLTALEQVMGRAPDCHWQDVNGKIKFVVGSTYKDLINAEVPQDGDRVLVKYLAFDPTQTEVKCNIVNGSFQTYKKSVEEKQNFLRIEFRDLEDEVFTKKYTYRDRSALRDYVGFLVDFGIVQIGVANQSLADRMGEAILRWNTDLDLFVKVRGMPDTYTLAKGDLVKFAHDVPEWTIDEAPLFIVIEESFESGTADERSFLLQVYSPDYYSDTQHGPIVPTLPSKTQSQLIAPDPVTFVLSEGSHLMPDGTYVPSIDGLVTFPVYYTQTGTVYHKSLTLNNGAVTYDYLTNTFTLATGYSVPANTVPVSLVSFNENYPVGYTHDQAYYTTQISGQTFKLSLEPNDGVEVEFTTDGAQLNLFNYEPWLVVRSDLAPNESFEDSFSVFPAPKGWNLVKVRNFSRVGASKILSDHPTEQIDIQGYANAPQAPGVMWTEYDGNTLRFLWEGVEENVVRYRVTDEFNRVILETTEPFYIELNRDPVINRRVYSISPLGVLSNTFSSATFVRPPRLEWTDLVNVVVNEDKSLTTTTTASGAKHATFSSALLMGGVLSRVTFSPHRDDVNQGINISPFRHDTAFSFYSGCFFNSDGTFGLSPGSSVFGSYEAGDTYFIESNPVTNKTKLFKVVNKSGSIINEEVYDYGVAKTTIHYVRAWTTATVITNINLRPVLFGHLTDSYKTVPNSAQNLVNATYSNGTATRTSGTGWNSSGLSIGSISANNDGGFSFNAFGGGGNNALGVAVGLTNNDTNQDITSMPFWITINGSGHMLFYTGNTLLYTEENPVDGSFPLVGFEDVYIERRVADITVFVGDYSVYTYNHSSLDTEELFLDIAFNGSLGSTWSVGNIKIFRPYSTVLNPDGNIPSVAVSFSDEGILGKNLVYDIPKFNLSNPLNNQYLKFNSDGELENVNFSLSSIPIGVSITGGGANRVLYQDSSTNLSTSSRFIFDGSDLSLVDTTPATVGSPQVKSPYFYLKGRRWNGSVDSQSDVRIYQLPRLVGGGDYVAGFAVDFNNGTGWIQSFAFGGTDTGLSTILKLRHPAVEGWGGNLEVTYDGVFSFKNNSNNLSGLLPGYITWVGSSALGYRAIRSNGYGTIIQGAFSQGLWVKTPEVGFGGPAYNCLEDKTSFGLESLGVAQSQVHIRSVTEQLRVGYDNSNYFSTIVSDTGATTIDYYGSASSISFRKQTTAKLTISDNVNITVALSTHVGLVVKNTNASNTNPHIRLLDNTDTNVLDIRAYGSGNNLSMFIGAGAGNGGTSTRNIGIGQSALEAIDTGTQNISIGGLSLSALETGSGNIAIGFLTLNPNSDGSHNVFIGDEAASQTSGTKLNNVGIGARVGYSLSSGDNNTLLGYRAGYSLTTGSSNVFIGFEAGYNETGSNKLYIANSNTSTPLIHGDFSSNEVKVNGYLSTLTGGSSSTLKIGGLLSVNTTDATTVDTASQSLMEYTIAANVLANTGDTIEVEYSGYYASNTNDKYIGVRFGTTDVGFEPKDLSGGTFLVRCTFTRSASDTVKYSFISEFSDNTRYIYNGTIGSLTFSSSIVVAARCRTPIQAGDLTIRKGFVKYFHNK